MEGNCILGLFAIDAGRVVRAKPMQRNEMQPDDGNDHERQQVVKRVEPVERWIAHRESAPEPRDDTVAKQRNCREQIRDHGCTPEAHLSPGQRIAKECGRHHHQQDDDTEAPEQFSRRLI